MCAGVGILRILVGNEYVLCIKVNMTPCNGVYGNPS
jgi:hypothetical protein